MKKRCTSCRHTETIYLPELDKKVIYLDQNIFSLIFSVKSGGKLPIGHEGFAKKVYAKLRRLVLLQQVILPDSDIHHTETVTFKDSVELRKAIETFGGGVSFQDSNQVAIAQVFEYGKAYIEGRLPNLNLHVDEVLEGGRNTWLENMQVFVNANFSVFAPGTRKSRDETHQAMQSIFNQWADEKPTFDDILNRELSSFCDNRLKVVEKIRREYEEALLDPDPERIIGLVGSSVMMECRALTLLFTEHGLSTEDAGRKIPEFWKWDQNKTQPAHRISCYLFAALGRRAAHGQNINKLTRGFVNDVTAISTYAPYVDAMFVDKDCHNLLSEKPLSADLKYKAKVFSLNDPASFLDYLDDIERQTPSEVRKFAGLIYGLE